VGTSPAPATDQNPRISGGLSCQTRVCRVLTPSESDLTIQAVDGVANCERRLGAGDVGVAPRRRGRRMTRHLLNMSGRDTVPREA
jgi:hypothetical protein